MSVQVDAPFTQRDEVGEGPHWDHATESLLRVDIVSGLVHRLEPRTGQQRTVRLSGRVGFVVTGSTGELIVGRQHTVEEIDLEGRTQRVLASVERDLDTRINDGKCDRRGRLFYGTISAAREPVGGLYRTAAAGEASRVVGGVTISNGLGWDDDRGRFYYIDSRTQRIDVFDYDLESGTAAERRAFAVIDPSDGLPDGLAVDAEGGVWVCLYGGWCVRRYSPDGTVSEAVSVPVSCPTSVAFGGHELRTMFVTSARHGLNTADKREQPLAGAVLVVDAGYRGQPGTGGFQVTARLR